jgi:hypothetical protein
MRLPLGEVNPARLSPSGEVCREPAEPMLDVVDGDEIEPIGVGADLQRRPARFGPAG